MRFIAPSPILKEGSDTVEVRKALTEIEAFMARIVYGEGFGVSTTDGKYLDFSNGYRAQEEPAPGIIPILDALAGLTVDSLSSPILKDVDYIQFDTTYTGTPLEGKAYWNSDDNTLNLGMKGGTVNLQVGQEMLLYAKNQEGSTITNGQAVRVLDASGSKPRVVLVNNLEEEATGTIALATETVTSPNYGYFTTYGYVRDIDTSALTEGADVYLGSTDGSLTATHPTNPSICVKIGTCLYKHASQGIIFVNIDVRELHRDRAITKDPTGFVDGCIVSYDSTTRKITLTGTVEAYWRGDRVTALAPNWVSTDHTATTGPWFLKYNGTAFSWSQLPWAFDELQIAYVYYGSTHKWGQRECHGFMPHDCHEADHNTIGCWKQSGGDLSGYTLSSTTAAERRPLVSAAVIHDEDLETTVAALATESYTQYYLSGAGASANFATAAADIVPLSTANPYWNQYTGGAWQQTLMANNTYMNIWLIALPVTADSGSQAYRFLWMQGQSNGNLTSETARTSQELNLGELTSLAPEIVFLAKVLIQYTAANWTIQAVTNLLGSRYSQVATPGGSFLSSVSVDADYLDGDGTAGDPLTLVDNPIPDSSAIAAYWPLGESPDVPDDPSGVTYNADWASGVDGWSEPNSGTLSVSGGELVDIANGTGAYLYKSYAFGSGKKYRLKYKTPRATLVSLYGTVDGTNNVLMGSFTPNINDWYILDTYVSGDVTALYTMQNGLTNGDEIRMQFFYCGSGLYLTPAIDASSLGHHGTVHGCLPVAGKYGKALDFNGSTDYIETSDIRHPTALTYAAWVRVDAWPTSYGFICTRTGENWWFAIYTSGGVHYLMVGYRNTAGSGLSYEVSIDGIVGLGEWHRFIGTHDGTNVRLYADGILIGTSSATSMQAEGSQSSAAYFLGAFNTTPEYVLNGALQHVRIDSRAWSDAEGRGDWAAGGQFIPGYRLPDYRQDNGLSATKTFYAASSSGGTVNVLNTVTIEKGLITAWTQV